VNIYSYAWRDASGCKVLQRWRTTHRELHDFWLRSGAPSQLPGRPLRSDIRPSGDGDQVGKQRYRAADARAELPRIMENNLSANAVRCRAAAISLASWDLLPTTYSMLRLAFAILLFPNHFNSRRTTAGPWHLADESTRAYLGLTAGCSTSSLTAEVAHNSGLIGLWCFGLRALSLACVETHALSGNWDRVPSARSAVPRTGNSCCGRRSRLWVRNQFQPPRTTTNEDRDR
jgi:hypothetical protein